MQQNFSVVEFLNRCIWLSMYLCSLGRRYKIHALLGMQNQIVLLGRKQEKQLRRIILIVRRIIAVHPCNDGIDKVFCINHVLQLISNIQLYMYSRKPPNLQAYLRILLFRRCLRHQVPFRLSNLRPV